MAGVSVNLGGDNRKGLSYLYTQATLDAENVEPEFILLKNRLMIRFDIVVEFERKKDDKGEILRDTGAFIVITLFKDEIKQLLQLLKEEGLLKELLEGEGDEAEVSPQSP